MRPFVLHIIVFATLWALPAQAEVLEAVFTPSSVLLTEQLNLSPDASGRATVYLPRQADPNSLTVAAARAEVLDVSWQLVKRRDEAAVEKLKERITDAKRARSAVYAKAASLDSRLAFWRELRLPDAADVNGAQSLAKAMETNIPPLVTTRGEVQNELDEHDKIISQLERRLQELTGAAEESWEITLLLAKAGKNASLTLKYAMADAGWAPIYRLEARPDDKTVHLSFEARIWQRSGRDLKAASVSLATVPLRTQLNPPNLPDWTIGPRQQLKRAVMLRAAAPAADMAMSGMAVEEAAPAPVDHATFREWKLGSKTIAAGPEQRLRVQELDLKADFTRLIRPAFDGRAFLRAAYTSKQSLDLPNGQALFLVDGVMVAKRSLTLAGTEGELFFGVDPQVRAETVLLTKAGGERGFFNQRQTATWKWSITVTNDRSAPVAVRLEEPKPQARDERVKLEVTAQPKPLTATKDTPPEDTHRLVWLLDVPAKSSQNVEWGVELTAPEDLNLDLGWR